ncbi:MAG TPA: TetR/AcrR family transcriptional regulator [Myxococcales bacterium]|nr:TetR/AcrR family transcriptional regulator [Myxococcales bacterium]
MLTRAAILAVASRHVEDHGFEAVSLRAVARELDVTAPALYDHVDSKSDLLALIAAEGFEEMVAQFRTVSATAATQRLRARALVYVAFAVEHPELFRLMFQYRPAEVAIELDNELPAATRALEINFADISEAIGKGELPDRDVVELSMMLWSAVHGVATVAMMVASAEHEKLAGDVIDAMLTGLRIG